MTEQEQRAAFEMWKASLPVTMSADAVMGAWVGWQAALAQAEADKRPCGHSLTDCSCKNTGLPHSDAYDTCRACERGQRAAFEKWFITKFSLALLALILAASPVFAQCPVEILDVNPRGATHMLNLGRGLGFVATGSDLTVKWKNISSKEIAGIKFGIAWIDAVGDQHPAHTGFTGEDKVKPGQTKKYQWDIPLNQDETRAEGWLTKVLFKDGTVWEDNGTHSCKGAREKKSFAPQIGCGGGKWSVAAPCPLEEKKP